MAGGRQGEPRRRSGQAEGSDSSSSASSDGEALSPAKRAPLPAARVRPAKRRPGEAAAAAAWDALPAETPGGFSVQTAIAQSLVSADEAALLATLQANVDLVVIRKTISALAAAHVPLLTRVLAARMLRHPASARVCGLWLRETLRQHMPLLAQQRHLPPDPAAPGAAGRETLQQLLDLLQDQFRARMRTRYALAEVHGAVRGVLAEAAAEAKKRPAFLDAPALSPQQAAAAIRPLIAFREAV